MVAYAEAKIPPNIALEGAIAAACNKIQTVMTSCWLMCCHLFLKLHCHNSFIENGDYDYDADDNDNTYTD